jgi:hypothetical protein
MDNWLQKLTDWFQDLLKKIFDAVLDFFHDIFIWCVELVLGAISSLVSSIPVPDFLTNNSMGDLINQLPSFALYVASAMAIPQAFLIILSGVSFRLLRKLLTLGQW